MKVVKVDDELYERLKKVAEQRALPSTVEKELARAVKLYLGKWEMFLAANRE